MNVCIKCKNFYESSHVRNIVSYGYLILMPLYFTIEDVSIGHKKLATQKVGDLQGINIEDV